MRSTQPKVLHPLGGRPIISHVLATIETLRPQQVVAVIAPGMEEVQRVCEESIQAAKIPLATVIQANQKGTGHAVLMAEAFIEDAGHDVLVVYGDTPILSSGTLQQMQDARRRSSNPAIVLMGAHHEGANSYGRIITNAAGEVEAIVEFNDATPEQQSLTLCNSGVMLFDGAHMLRLLKQLTPQNAQAEYYLTDTVRHARAEGLSVQLVEGEGKEMLGINSRQDLAQLEAILQKQWRRDAMERGATLLDPNTVYFSYDTCLGRDVTIGPQVVLGPGVKVGDYVTISPFCVLSGATIEAHATIGPFAHLRPGVSIGEKAQIGNFVELNRSIVHEGAKIKHLSYIGDAEIGNEANIGAGTITCNYDGFRKHQTRIGKKAFIGSNTALIAPITIGDEAIIGAGSVINESVGPQALAVARGEQKTVAAGAARFRQQRAKK
jgi:bifunctional UDP-N-acetylglucosamine pyrophosphorylase/glucosamine-1-phosphate N-acetyltransferase